MKKRLIAFSLALIGLTGCSSNTSKNSDPIEYEVGTHILMKVDKNIQWFWGKNEKFSLESPTGYKILDYDYDYDSGDGREYQDYVYVNTESVLVTNEDDFGSAISEKSTEQHSQFHQPGEHIIVDVQRKLNWFWGKNGEKIDLTAPDGYEVVDYDYDKTHSFEFETITYQNKTKVKTTNKDDFNNPIEKSNQSNKNYYETGEHKIVTVNRNFNIFWGKNETKQLTTPEGYKVVDYDYDKADSFEFETIMYENIVPVSKKKNDFGLPLKQIKVNKHSNGIYGSGEHVIVNIDRKFKLWVGYHQMRKLDLQDGYTLLDYDYDKNDSFEFQTYVYTNNDSVKVDNVNDFGKIVKTKQLKK